MKFTFFQFQHRQTLNFFSHFVYVFFIFIIFLFFFFGQTSILQQIYGFNFVSSVNIKTIINTVNVQNSNIAQVYRHLYIMTSIKDIPLKHKSFILETLCLININFFRNVNSVII